MAAPVGNTCPDIDRIISHIRNASKIAAAGLKQSERGSDDYHNYNEIENDLWNLEGMLEQLRRDNSELRTWGTECEAKIRELEDQVYELEISE